MIDDPIENEENLIEWTESCELSWDDFQGTSRTDMHQALTAATLRRDITDTIVFEEKGVFYFRFESLKVKNFFKRNESWVLPKQKTADNHEIILKHEQGHFDINEIFRRDYQRDLDKLMLRKWECKGNTEDERKQFSLKKGRRLLYKLEKKFRKKSKEIQDGYDKETNFGLDVKKQFDYLKKIKKQLNLDSQKAEK